MVIYGAVFCTRSWSSYVILTREHFLEKSQQLRLGDVLQPQLEVEPHPSIRHPRVVLHQHLHDAWELAMVKATVFSEKTWQMDH